MTGKIIYFKAIQFLFTCLKGEIHGQFKMIIFFHHFKMMEHLNTRVILKWWNLKGLFERFHFKRSLHYGLWRGMCCIFVFINCQSYDPQTFFFSPCTYKNLIWFRFLRFSCHLENHLQIFTTSILLLLFIQNNWNKLKNSKKTQWRQSKTISSSNFYAEVYHLKW